MRSCLIALVLLAACGKNEKPPPTSNVAFEKESAPPSRQGGAGAGDAAKNYFAQTCAMCHGMDGTGNGPAATTLNPKPRNYTDPNWQASIKDAEIKQIIVEGGAALGKSASMPPNPGLKGNNEVLDGLVAIIRGFGKK